MCTGSGDLVLVERFILLGLSIMDQSQNGWDVLMWACLGGHAAVVSKLLSLGSNIAAKDAEQRLGLHWAAEKGHAEAVGVLVKEMLQANMDIQAQVRFCCSLRRLYNWFTCSMKRNSILTRAESFAHGKYLDRDKW